MGTETCRARTKICPPQRLSWRTNPEDINKYEGQFPEAWPGLRGTPLPSAPLVATPGAHDPVADSMSSPLSPQEAGGARASRACT